MLLRSISMFAIYTPTTTVPTGGMPTRSISMFAIQISPVRGVTCQPMA